MSNLFIYWIVLLPFIVWGGHYEGPKVFYFLSGSIVLLIFWIVRVYKHKNNFDFVTSDYFFLMWLVLLFISSLLGVHPLESILGGSYRHQGVIFFIALWLVGKTLGVLERQEKILLIKSIGISILIESLLVILQFLFGHLYFAKSLGTLGEANAVAGFVAIGTYFVYQSLPKILLLLPTLAILLEVSRSGISALIPNLIMIFTEIFKKLSRVLLLVTFVFSICLVLGISFVKPISQFENRPLFWKMATDAITQKPMIGFGAESGEWIYNAAFKKAEMPLSNLIVDRAHNLFLDITLWSGILGLILFGGWFYLSFKSSNDLGKKYALLSFLIYAMFQPLSIVHWILLIIIVNI